MRAAVFGETGQIALTDRDQPEPRPGWVRLSIGAVGICGSDLNFLYAHGDASKGVQPGHEMAGVVEATGDNATIATGTRVAVEPVTGCGRCGYCRRGLPNLCPEVRLFGFARPGGMAEQVVVPESSLYTLPGDLPHHIAALAEPMAVAVRGVRLGNVALNERVVVLGGGSIGALCILAARAAGAGEILVTARHPHQRELATALGADRVFGDAAAVLDAVGEQHADVVLETVGGRANTLTEAVQVVRNGGRIVMLGVFEGAPTLPGLDFFRKELTLRGSNCYGHECATGDFAAATDLIVRHRDQLDPVVSHRFKLDQVADAFAAAADKSTRSIKVQIHP